MWLLLELKVTLYWNGLNVKNLSYKWIKSNKETPYVHGVVVYWLWAPEYYSCHATTRPAISQSCNSLKDWWYYLHNLITEEKNNYLWRQSQSKWQIRKKTSVGPLKGKSYTEAQRTEPFGMIQYRCKVKSLSGTVKNHISTANCFKCIFPCKVQSCADSYCINHIYHWYIHHQCVNCTFGFRVTGASFVCRLMWHLLSSWSFSQRLRMDRMGSWEIKASCVLTVVFHDVGLCLSCSLSCCSVALLYTVRLRQKVRGVNEKLSGQCSRPRIRFLRGREQASWARSSFTYEVIVWK